MNCGLQALTCELASIAKKQTACEIDGTLLAAGKSLMALGNDWCVSTYMRKRQFRHRLFHRRMNKEMNAPAKQDTATMAKTIPVLSLVSIIHPMKGSPSPAKR